MFDGGPRRNAALIVNYGLDANLPQHVNSRITAQSRIETLIDSGCNFGWEHVIQASLQGGGGTVDDPIPAMQPSNRCVHVLTRICLQQTLQFRSLGSKVPLESIRDFGHERGIVCKCVG